MTSPVGNFRVCTLITFRVEGYLPVYNRIPFSVDRSPRCNRKAVSWASSIREGGSCSLALHFLCKQSYALCVQNPVCRTWFRLRISSLWPPSFLQTTTSYIILHFSHKDQSVWRTNAMNAARLSLLNARSKNVSKTHSQKLRTPCVRVGVGG